MTDDEERRLIELAREAAAEIAANRARGIEQAEADLRPIRATQEEIDMIYLARVESMLALVPDDPEGGEIASTPYSRAQHLCRELEPHVSGLVRAELDDRLRLALRRFGIGNGPAPSN